MSAVGWSSARTQQEMTSHVLLSAGRLCGSQQGDDQSHVDVCWSSVWECQEWTNDVILTAVFPAHHAGCSLCLQTDCCWLHEVIQKNCNTSGFLNVALCTNTLACQAFTSVVAQSDRTGSTPGVKQMQVLLEGLRSLAKPQTNI
jgi:hypothetical protein